LVDAKLLANVYLELKGGRERGLDFAYVVQRPGAAAVAPAVCYGPRPRPLAPRATEAELARHAAFVRDALKGGLWAAFAA
jgi:DNA polymerase-3 subunit epsilon